MKIGRFAKKRRQAQNSSELIALINSVDKYMCIQYMMIYPDDSNFYNLFIDGRLDELTLSQLYDLKGLSGLLNIENRNKLCEKVKWFESRDIDYLKRELMFFQKSNIATVPITELIRLKQKLIKCDQDKIKEFQHLMLEIDRRLESYAQKVGYTSHEHLKEHDPTSFYENYYLFVK